MATTNTTGATAATTGKTYTTKTVLCETVIPSDKMMNGEDMDEKVTFAWTTSPNKFGRRNNICPG